MTDNDNTSASRPGGPPESTGTQKGQRRRGRRRSRRRGQSAQQPQQQKQAPTGQDTTERPSTDNAGADSANTGAPNRSRQRRRRSNRGGNNRPPQKAGQKTGQKSDQKTGSGATDSAGQNRRNQSKGGNRTKGGAQNRRGAAGRGRQGGAPSQHNRNTSANRHRGPDTSRMVTRDETSAGGLVLSGLAEAVGADGSVDLSRIYVALIGRLDRRGRLLWSMPKGHVEPGEGQAATAEREIWEETGIRGTVIGELGVIDYWFVSDGVRIHKTVHHHLLRYADGDLNDEDPEVTEVAWIPAAELIEHLAYADERKLARIAHDQLPDLARKEKAEGKATPR